MGELFVTESDIESGLSQVLQSPEDRGTLEAILIRPKEGERELLESAYLSPEEGIQGDRWTTSSKYGTRNQVSLINVRMLDLITVTKERWSLAGDNLIVDLDLREENLPAGQLLAIDDVILEVTDLAHNGCRKFLARYGKEASNFVNAADRQGLHLRGVYARILKGGNINVGSIISKAVAESRPHDQMNESPTCCKHSAGEFHVSDSLQ